ncbi:MAG TPA: YraN family protein [Steroidobacteraceae bacterium]|nr:YraN family protein [Steroidobacteraceae bacterium]
MRDDSAAAAPPDPRHDRGAAAERLAAAFLEARGLAVLLRNFRCRQGELDLVCADAGFLVVVEVRQRSGTRFGGALASVTAAKRRRIMRATAVLLLRTRRWRYACVRFDVVGIQGRPDAAPEIIWIKDAFRGGRGAGLI